MRIVTDDPNKTIIELDITRKYDNGHSDTHTLEVTKLSSDVFGESIGVNFDPVDGYGNGMWISITLDQEGTLSARINYNNGKDSITTSLVP